MQKKFNFILVVLSSVCLWAAIKYSSMPIPKWLPQNIAAYISSTMQEREEYAILYDLAIALLASSIFYFIVDVIPQIIRTRMSKIILRQYFNSLVASMEKVISVVVQQYGINSDLHQLTEKDFMIMNGDDDTPKAFLSVKQSLYDNRGVKINETTYSPESMNEIIVSRLDIIEKMAKTIRNNEYLYASNLALVACIRNIEESTLVFMYKKENSNVFPKPHTISCFSYENTSVHMLKFVVLYLELLKYKYHKQYTRTTIDRVQVHPAKNYNIQDGINYSIHIQQRRKELAVKYPMSVICSNQFNSKVIATELQNFFGATIIDIESVQATDLMYDSVVIIIDKSSLKMLNRLVRKTDSCQKIILLTEHCVSQKSYRQLFAHRDANDVYEIHFRSSWRIPLTNIQINKDEPTSQTISIINQQIEKYIYGADWCNDISI